MPGIEDRNRHGGASPWSQPQDDLLRDLRSQPDGLSQVDKPRRWDVARIRNFMLGFGLISSAFDALTFALLLLVLHVAPEEFRTAWFVESLLTELAILLVVRTHRPLTASVPSAGVLWAAAAVAAAAVALPYLPAAATFGFVPLPPQLMAMLLAITFGYVIVNEWAKRRYRQRFAL